MLQQAAQKSQINLTKHLSIKSAAYNSILYNDMLLLLVWSLKYDISVVQNFCKHTNLMTSSHCHCESAIPRYLSQYRSESIEITSLLESASVSLINYTIMGLATI